VFGLRVGGRLVSVCVHQMKQINYQLICHDDAPQTLLLMFLLGCVALWHKQPIFTG